MSSSTSTTVVMTISMYAKNANKMWLISAKFHPILRNVYIGYAILKKAHTIFIAHINRFMNSRNAFFTFSNTCTSNSDQSTSNTQFYISCEQIGLN